MHSPVYTRKLYAACDKVLGGACWLCCGGFQAAMVSVWQPRLSGAPRSRTRTQAVCKRNSRMCTICGSGARGGFGGAGAGNVTVASVLGGLGSGSPVCRVAVWRCLRRPCTGPGAGGRFIVGDIPLRGARAWQVRQGVLALAHKNVWLAPPE